MRSMPQDSSCNRISRVPTHDCCTLRHFEAKTIILQSKLIQEEISICWTRCFVYKLNAFWTAFSTRCNNLSSLRHSSSTSKRTIKQEPNTSNAYSQRIRIISSLKWENLLGSSLGLLYPWLKLMRTRRVVDGVKPFLQQYLFCHSDCVARRVHHLF